MKVPALLITTALLTFLALPAPAAPPAPAVGIAQALNLAVTHLQERGLTGTHYITGLTLEDSAITGGQRYWYARWSPSIKGADKTYEAGLQISMDGSLARIVSGGPHGVGRPDNPGQRRVGARSMR